MILRALGGTGDKRADYWSHRVKPFIVSTWPKSASNRSPDISVSLAQACVAADDDFPEAADTVCALLVPAGTYHSFVDALAQSGICQRHTEKALILLDAVVDENHR
ncbi:MAG: hypothetical protein OHK0028_21640 [Deltaproteobacteria bacterium]